MKFVGKSSESDRHGLSLGGALLAVSVLAVLAFTLASLSVTHLQLSSRQEHGLAASNAARSVVSQAISQILQAKEFGEARLVDEGIRLETSHSLGLLTFHQGTAQREGLPYSTNNLNRTEDTHGADDVLVPSSTVHLVGVGRSAGVERRVEAVLRLPPFPWAIASGGRVETRNGVLIAALPHGVWPPPTREEDLLPADLLANGTDAQAVMLASGSTILGDVETPGQVVKADGVQIRGEIRAGSSKVDLPTLRPTDYDPRTSGREHFPVTGSEAELTGSARGQGVVTFSQPLTLSNAHLFVEGELRLPRGVSGSGVIVATGDISIGGATNLEGMTELAVISGGRVTLSGHGTERSYLRGLFYAEEGLRAADLTLVGSLLTGHASTGVELDHVNVFYEPVIAEETGGGGVTNGGIEVRLLPVSGPRMVEVGASQLSVEMRTTTEDPSTMQDLKVARAFYIDLEPTNGGFPVDISVVQGVMSFSMPTQTLDDQADVEVYLDSLGEAMNALKYDASIPAAGWGGAAMAYDSAGVEELKIQLRSQLTAELSKAAADSTQGTSGDVPVDLSQFLPIEDRIRVVSWIER